MLTLQCSLEHLERLTAAAFPAIKLSLPVFYSRHSYKPSPASAALTPHIEADQSIPDRSTVTSRSIRTGAWSAASDDIIAFPRCSCCSWSPSRMLPASIQITGEQLSAAEVQDICESLKEDSVRLLSIRGCQLSDRDFGRICRSVAESRSLAQLNLNLGVVSSISRTRHLADAMSTNRSLQTLFLHGSPLLDAGLVTLNSALSTHPALVCLDLGDCMLGDEALGLICGMLPPDGAKSGLRELTLSANPGISSKGWARLSIAVAHSSQLRVLNLDYNLLGDQIAGMLAVAVASSRTLEVLDLEGTGLTNQSAQVFLDMVENYPTCLRVLVLAENDISAELQQQICDLLSEGDDDREAPPFVIGANPSSALMSIRDKYQPIRDKYQPPTWLPHSNSSPEMVLLTSGLGESLLDETEM
ncbi:leucine-rich repeat-containing protein 73 isoform X1 [Paralichthys olivaceus]|uniref:leucine-rich repeat-containing protein 73 isoform X1 n=2 Tax=Paralichthys olivaceus TaxID=8255 RepID=UPI003752485C